MMQALVDETVAAVFPGERPEVGDAIDRQGCGSESDEELIDYEVSIRVPPENMDAAIAAVTARWAPLGADSRPGDGISIELDGYLIGLTPFSDEGRVAIGGSTDCFPPD